ncbi:HAD-IIIA family hydrolase [Acidipila sp. EB88]|uniref:D-glycero-alpha-D-manno-heptose-1,7-bisphosphate 7-phosphatase n=1 Tax=Acidipila sp. EB88 TaxID=2305226 RepID=UPI001F3A2752|nr:HAD family hydrolase [Acidipila sp. EB88]
MKTAISYRGIQTVFLDRDGVLNRKAPEGEYVSRWDLFHPLPGIEEALHRLNVAGIAVYVVTNQRGVALGLYTTRDVEHLHARLQEDLRAHDARVDGFFYCPHDKGVCDCRKPKTGLFEQARALHPEIDYATSLMVGDSVSDIEAGQRAGMRTIFIEGEPERQKPGADRGRTLADAVSTSLGAAVELILRDQ